MSPTRATTRSGYRERVLAVVAHLAEHLDEAPDLALKTGFCDQAAFMRTFRNAYGTPPSKFRASEAKPRPISPFELYVSDMDTRPEDALITELYVAIE